MKPPCRIAVLGCGAVSENYYLPALQYLEAEGAAVLSAAFDPDAGRAARFCAQFPHSTAQAEESFLQKMPLDLVLIASPVNSHEEHAIRAFEAGLDVLCEKPLAGDVAAGERMIAAARKHQRMLAVGLLRRFYSNIQLVRRLVHDRTFGAVKSFELQEGNPFDWPLRSDSLFRKATAGGGVLLDLGVHVLDLVVHWFGEPQSMTYADDAMGGLESNCRMELTYPGNVKGSILLSRDFLTKNLYVIEFERATVKIPFGRGEELNIEIDGEPFVLSGLVKRYETSPVFTAATFPQAFLAQLQDVIDAWQRSRAPKVTGEEGIRSLRLIEKCYRNRTFMEIPWLSPEERKKGQFLAAGGSI